MGAVFDESWREFLEGEFRQEYFRKLAKFLQGVYSEREIFPAKEQVFAAFKTDFSKIRVVILGQDPYHTPGAAHGLAFSVPKGRVIPPSLVNIYKEIDADIGQHQNEDGNLTNWQNQGVLLLNNILTVEAGRAGSHRKQGWEIFSEAVIRHLNAEREGLVFLLWGRDAREKRRLIDTSKHLVLEAAHPSPLSAHNGFFGCRHFSQCNEYLRKQGLAAIEW